MLAPAVVRFIHATPGTKDIKEGKLPHSTLASNCHVWDRIHLHCSSTDGIYSVLTLPSFLLV